jgi:N utilization substance protein A
MFDIKIVKAALEQLESEKKIPKESLIEAIEQSLAAAYKKDFGKRDQIIKTSLNMESGDVEFTQIKIVTDATTTRPELTPEELLKIKSGEYDEESEDDERPRFNPERHIDISLAKMIKGNVELGEELEFPMGNIDPDFGRVAAQTAKQVILQRIREAERDSVMREYADKEGQIVTGVVQKYDRGNVFVDLGRAIGVMNKDERIDGEFYKPGQHIKVFLFRVEDSMRGGIQLRLSRSHPLFVKALFEMESPEVSTGVVELRSIARESGSRTKIAVFSHDDAIDPIGACVGGRGVRVTAVMNELNGEKIDIVPWSEDPAEFIANSLLPAQVLAVELNETDHIAHVEVAEDQLSLAIGKGGQNARLAAKLTGWKVDIKGIASEQNSTTPSLEGEDGFSKLEDLVNQMIDPIQEELSDVVESEDSTDEIMDDAEFGNDPAEEINQATQ